MIFGTSRNPGGFEQTQLLQKSKNQDTFSESIILRNCGIRKLGNVKHLGKSGVNELENYILVGPKQLTLTIVKKTN